MPRSGSLPEASRSPRRRIADQGGLHVEGRRPSEIPGQSCGIMFILSQKNERVTGMRSGVQFSVGSIALIILALNPLSRVFADGSKEAPRDDWKGVQCDLKRGCENCGGDSRNGSSRGEPEGPCLGAG